MAAKKAATKRKTIAQAVRAQKKPKLPLPKPKLKRGKSEVLIVDESIKPLVRKRLKETVEKLALGVETDIKFAGSTIVSTLPFNPETGEPGQTVIDAEAIGRRFALALETGTIAAMTDSMLRPAPQPIMVPPGRSIELTFDEACKSKGVRVGNLAPGSQFTLVDDACTVYTTNDSEVRAKCHTGRHRGDTLTMGPATMVLPGYRREFLPTPADRPSAPEKPVSRDPGAKPPVKRERAAVNRNYDPSKRLLKPPKKIPNTTKIPVVWTGANGKHSARVWDYAIRPLARWCGADGWSRERTKVMFVKLGLGEYPDLDYHVIHAHVTAGSKCGHGGVTPYGPVPKLDAKQAETLRKLSPA